MFPLQPPVQTTFLHKLVNEEPIGVRHAIAENIDDVWVAELTQYLHLGPKLSKALESILVELPDGDGDAVGELGLVDEAEAAVADDQVGGEVVGGDNELLRGD